VTQDDLLYRFRLRTFATAAELGNVPAPAAPWARSGDPAATGTTRAAHGQRHQPLVEQRVVAFALGHPGFGPARIAAELAQRFLRRTGGTSGRRANWPGLRLSLRYGSGL
jgi:hypothetical protein